jgi:uncharacterized membrane protein
VLPHTVVVDFAVALLLTSVITDLLARLADEDEFRVVATWTLVFGAVAAIFAAISGYAAYDDAAPTGVAEAVVLNHRNAGLALLACFVPAAIWRLASGGRPPARLAGLYWTLIAVGTAAVVVAAYLGGTAVFRHGVGVLNG